MNDSTDNTTESGDKKLQSAFGDRGTNVNAISYGHPYAEQILDGAKEIIRESETGASLLRGQTHNNIPIHVIKGNGQSGFNPQARVIYLQVSGKIDKSSPKIVLDLIKGLREAEQDLIGFIAPDPTKDIMEYAATMHAKAVDAIIYICKVVKELTNSSYFSVLLDEMKQIGHIKLYQAYIAGSSKEELYKVYAGV